jgi:hypothetical protein
MNITTFKQKIASLPRTLIVTIFSLVGILILGIFLYLDGFMYPHKIEANIASEIERIAKIGVTATSCADL